MENSRESVFDIIDRTGKFPVHCVHRGGGYDFGPENTMYSFLKSVENRVRLIEIDLILTKDSHLVLMHDSTVDRTTNGTGQVSSFTLEEIQKLDAAFHYPQLCNSGIKVPTFKEFLDTFVPVQDLLFMLDFKNEFAVEKALEFVKEYGIENRLILGSVFEKPNQMLFQMRPSSNVPVITDISQTFAIVVAYNTGFLDWYTWKGHAIFGYILLKATDFFWSKGLVDELHSQGLKVMVCGAELNRAERIKECIEFGVDFIMTDQPDIYNSAIKEIEIS